MAVCNLFKTLDTNSNDGQGIFFTFSQYAEDLTKQQTEGEHYRVSPSKFACLNLIPTSATNIPETLQDLYENKVSYFREITNDDEYKWNNFDASILLWGALAKDSIISKSGSGDTAYYSQLKYVGDIDIYSNEVINGTNYSEIYCLVPPDAAATKYYNITNIGDSFTYEDADQTIINGWTDATYPEGTQMLSSSPIFDDSTNYTYTGEEYPYILSNSDLSNVSASSLYTLDTSSSTGFKFNTMILFYDVVDEDNDVIIRNLPLGIWFSGGYNSGGASDEKLYNFVNKFTASNTVYGQGTSYGLRVCTKLIGTPFGTANEINVGSTDGEYDSLSAVCEAFTETLNELDKIYDKLELNQDSMADYLNNFTSGKVNVPYPKLINGVYYWFINGRNTNIPMAYEGNIPVQSDWDAPKLIDGAPNPAFIQHKPEIGNGEITIKQGEQLLGKFNLNQTENYEISFPTAAPQKQANWEESDNTDVTFIRNKPDILPINITSATNGQILTYNNTSGKWENTNQTISGIKKLNTTAYTSQATNANEDIIGSGTINLHKIAKTGTITDILPDENYSEYGYNDIMPRFYGVQNTQNGYASIQYSYYTELGDYTLSISNNEIILPEKPSNDLNIIYTLMIGSSYNTQSEYFGLNYDNLNNVAYAGYNTKIIINNSSLYDHYLVIDALDEYGVYLFDKDLFENNSGHYTLTLPMGEVVILNITHLAENSNSSFIFTAKNYLSAN